jgi:predicted RNA-binding protein YlqC (UPF0109 family)
VTLAVELVELVAADGEDGAVVGLRGRAIAAVAGDRTGLRAVGPATQTFVSLV